MQAAWWFVLAISVIIYLLLTAFVLPKIIFRQPYEVRALGDRGLKNYREKNGRSILCEPEPEYRKFIRQYILSEKNGKKVIVCRTEESISRIDYDVTLFDCDNKPFKTINIKENIISPGYTRAAQLPLQAAYVSIAVNSVDNLAVGGGAEKKISKRKTALFAAAAGLLIFLEIFFIKFCVGSIFGDVFDKAFMTHGEGTLITLGIGLAAAAVAAAAVVVYIWLTNKKNSRAGRL